MLARSRSTSRALRTTNALFLLAALPAAAATTVIGWEEADKFVGQEVTVEGRVHGVHCSPTACLLAFEPTFNRFTAVIQARRFAEFPPEEVERVYTGRRVRVRGRMEEREKKPEIQVESRDALALVEDGPSASERTHVADVEAQAMERMAAVLERVEALTERLAAVQERLDVLLAQLEQRAAMLAAAEAPPMEPMAGGAPPARPAFQALRTVKRGMSRADVERLVGLPAEVEDGGPGGWTTWHYGYGRSVSFDARGRVQSLVGFPAP